MKKQVTKISGILLCVSILLNVGSINAMDYFSQKVDRAKSFVSEQVEKVRRAGGNAIAATRAFAQNKYNNAIATTEKISKQIDELRRCSAAGKCTPQQKTALRNGVIALTGAVAVILAATAVGVATRGKKKEPMSTELPFEETSPIAFSKLTPENIDAVARAYDVIITYAPDRTVLLFALNNNEQGMRTAIRNQNVSKKAQEVALTILQRLRDGR